MLDYTKLYCHINTTNGLNKLTSTLLLVSVFTAQCTLEQSAVLGFHVVHLSVLP